MEQLNILIQHMASIPDFRKAKGKQYKLHNILVISILALISGADDFEHIGLFASEKADFLSKIGLIEGEKYPSHDLFRWVFMNIDPQSLTKVLGTWLQSIVSHSQESAANTTEMLSTLKQVCIDGKSLRATRTKEHSRSALQIVSAFMADHQITIAQLLIDAKSCEKTAVPQLVDLLDVKDTIITIDAIGTQRKVANSIAERGGDYVLALKKNNKILYGEVDSFFLNFADTTIINSHFEDIDSSHGRISVRHCSTITALQYFPDVAEWKNLNTLIKVNAQRTIKDKTSNETRYYITSLKADAQALNEIIRRHWSIENQLHWSLDVVFNEDKQRVRDKNAANCLSALRRFVLAVLKNHPLEMSIPKMRNKAAWNNDFLKNVFDYFIF